MVTTEYANSNMPPSSPSVPNPAVPQWFIMRCISNVHLGKQWKLGGVVSGAVLFTALPTHDGLKWQHGVIKSLHYLLPHFMIDVISFYDLSSCQFLSKHCNIAYYFMLLVGPFNAKIVEYFGQLTETSLILRKSLVEHEYQTFSSFICFWFWTFGWTKLWIYHLGLLELAMGVWGASVVCARFFIDIHVSQMMYPNGFSDPLSFHLVPDFGLWPNTSDGERSCVPRVLVQNSVVNKH